MKELLFDSYHQWKVCFLSGCKKLCWGLCRIITCIILGVLSVLRWLWHRLVDAVGSYPALAIVVAVAVCIAVWALTFAQGRAKLVTAEYQRDSLCYELSESRKNNDKGKSVVFDKDTITMFDSYDKP
jgi:hypothetical protein